MPGKPKPGFYIAIFLVIAGLVGIGIWRFSGGKKKEAKEMSLPKKDKADTPEDPSTAADGVTTVSEYTYVPAQKLPEVKGSSNYKSIGKSRTVKFAVNVWAGWAPIFYANEGKKAKKQWTTPGGEPFKVELVLIDDPVAMRDAYVSGDVHIGWATVDMLPLLLEGMKKDSRVAPRVYQQIDWSNGGDGIVVRDYIKTMSDLRGKKVVLAQNSPSQFFVLNALLNSGVQPREVDFKYTADAFQAAAAFRADKSIAACVSWAPDIYNLTEKVKGNRLLVSTGTANKLIADVWFARADFAKDHPDIIEGLVRGIFDAMVELEGNDANKAKVAKWMAAAYSLPEKDALSMLGDAHWTNFAENREFFLVSSNPTNFERTFNTSYYLYRQLPDQVVTEPFVSFDSVMDFSVIKKLEGEPKYANQKNTYDFKFEPASADAIQAESPEILTKTVQIHFYPNSDDINKTVTKRENGKDVVVPYAPNGKYVVEEVGKLAGQYGAAQIVIEGHTDSSMKGRVPPSLVQALSMRRAEAVKKAVATKFPKLDPNQFAVKGWGWDKPAEPGNHGKNRRVEIKVYPAEAGTE